MLETTPDPDALTRSLLPSVLEAARVELAHFSNGVAVSSKADASPVTIADQEAEAILLEALARAAPHIPVIAEELAAAGALPAASDMFFLVDALDGTRYFISGTPEFSINVALVAGGRPIYGLIYAPPTGTLYLTRSDGGAYGGLIAPRSRVTTADSLDALQPLRTRAYDRSQLFAYTSRNSAGRSADFVRSLGVRAMQARGSSEKFCLIAAGRGDIYARFGPTYEWDTAAGQAILEGAGGSVTTVDGAPLRYGKADGGYLNPGFIAWGREALQPSSPTAQDSSAGSV